MRRTASLFFRSWKYEKIFAKLRFLLAFVVLLVGCQQEENNVAQKSTTKKTEEKVQITKEEEKSIQDIIHTFVRTTNEKILQNIWSYFQRRCLVLKT